MSNAKSNARNFAKYTKKVASSVESGVRRAMKRAVASGKSQAVKLASKDSGLPAKRIKPRFWTDKIPDVKQKNPKSGITIGVKFGIALHELKPRIIKIRKAAKLKTGRSKTRTYYGVQIRQYRQRRFVAGAFMQQTRNGKKDLVLKRRGVSKYPLDTPTSKVVAESVEANADHIGKHMQDSFRKNAEHEIEYALKKVNKE